MSDKYNFQKLTPKGDSKLDVYDEAISYVFENEDIRNIAISGAYSSGKSTLIESYKNKHQDKKFLHISLACFQSLAEENNTNNNGERIGKVSESVLEGKILNQLIHQIPSNKIPQSNFRIKKEISNISVLYLTIRITLFVICCLLLYFHNNIIQYTISLPGSHAKTLLTFITNPYVMILSIILLIASVSTFIYRIAKAQKNRNTFGKISLQGNEIEIFEKQEDSYFDKYLNEVLYLFEKAEADAIVFEDMDRFNVTMIFERLREVNTLVNIHRKKYDSQDKTRCCIKNIYKRLIGNKREYVPLRFFYLIRDDIFVSKDRTKFFDFIIPVVPIVDGSNSYEQFTKQLKEGDLLSKFNLSFLQGISLYIDDMRVLKNIYNEFVIYNNRLNTTDLDYDKMLSIVTYKNIFPKDFSDLQLKKGFVFEIFSQKNTFVNSLQKSLEEKMANIANRIQAVEKEYLTTNEELDLLYKSKLNALSNQYGLSYQQKEERKKQYAEEYNERMQTVKDKYDVGIEALKGEVDSIQIDISKNQSKKLKEVISRENINAIFSVKFKNEIDVTDEFVEIRGSKYFELLKYLIRNGYIDETYPDYMTYFNEGSISSNDKIFLRRITDKRGADFSYSLKEPSKVISSPLIRQVDFEEPEVLNFDLMNCLLDNCANKQYDSYIKTLVSQLRTNNEYDFVSQYYDMDLSCKTFVIKINEYWNEFFNDSLNSEILNKEQLYKYSIDTLYYSDNDTIISININGCLASYISNKEDYLKITQPNISKLLSGFKLLSISFKRINYDLSDKYLFHKVYEENLYEFSFANIKLMMDKVHSIEERDIIHKNFTMIQSIEESPLGKYVRNNLPLYFDEVLENCNGEVKDKPDSIIFLLNCDDLKIEKKEKYISLLSTKLDDLSLINEVDLWDSLLVKGLIIFAENNLFHYYKEFNDSDVFLNYINSFARKFHISNISDDFDIDLRKKFFNSIVMNNKIDTNKYKNIILEFNYKYNAFSFDNIEAEKMSILISNKIILMSIDNLLYLRSHYKEQVMEFIETNLDDYLKIQNIDIFDLIEALEVIKFDISVDSKIELIKLTDIPISIINNKFEDKLNEFILTHNLYENDLSTLYNMYSNYNEATKEKIFELAILNIDNITDLNLEVDNSLLSLIFKSDEVDFSYKVDIFNNIISHLNEESCSTIFDEIGVSGLKKIFTKGSGRRKYNLTDDTIKVLKVLKDHNWIYEYNIDENDQTKCYIIKRKQNL